MDVSNVMRSDELPFPVPGWLAHDVDELVGAMAVDSCMLDCYQDEVWGSSRDVPPEEERFVQRYYVLGGWRTGTEYKGTVYGGPEGVGRP